VLIHVVDVSGASGRDPVNDFKVIVKELQLFDPAVASKPQIVAANKIDALDDPSRLERLERYVARQKLPLFRISGVTGEGVDQLLAATWRQLGTARSTAASSQSGSPPGRDHEGLASRRA
jgi:GTP-binding protein